MVALGNQYFHFCWSTHSISLRLWNYFSDTTSIKTSFSPLEVRQACSQNTYQPLLLLDYYYIITAQSLKMMFDFKWKQYISRDIEIGVYVSWLKIQIAICCYRNQFKRKPYMIPRFQYQFPCCVSLGKLYISLWTVTLPICCDLNMLIYIKHLVWHINCYMSICYYQGNWFWMDC